MKATKKRPRLVQPYMLTRPTELTGFVDIERGLDLFPPFTGMILILQLIVFIWSGYTYTSNPTDNLLIEGQFQGYWLTSVNGWLRMVSSTFLHSGLEHLIGNMALLYLASVMLEHLYGIRAAATGYLVFLLAQAGASYIYYDDKTSTVGASGVVFGLVGFLCVMYGRYRREIFVRHRLVGLILAILTFFSVYQGLRSQMVNNAAHLGGLIAGMLFAFAVQPRFLKEELAHPPRVKSVERAILLAFVVLALGPFLIYQSNLSARRDLSLEEKLANLIDFLVSPSGVRGPDVTYWTLVQEKPREEEAPQEPTSKQSQDSKNTDENLKNESKSSGQSESKTGGEGESTVCPICIEGQPCKCAPGCKWTYFHHFADRECRVKIKTTIWGPGTGSPFSMGFENIRCQEAAGRYYLWERPSEGCFAPKK